VQEAVEWFEADRGAIEPSACRHNAERFSVGRFRREMAGAFDETLAMHA
jgi:hypothetical protein